MKYRVITRDDPDAPYIMQRQDETSWFKFWWTKSRHKELYAAENAAKRLCEQDTRIKPDTVVFEYDETDLVADRLRNRDMEKAKRYDDREEAASCSVTTPGP